MDVVDHMSMCNQPSLGRFLMLVVYSSGKPFRKGSSLWDMPIITSQQLLHVWGELNELLNLYVGLYKMGIFSCII